LPDPRHVGQTGLPLETFDPLHTGQTIIPFLPVPLHAEHAIEFKNLLPLQVGQMICTIDIPPFSNINC